MKPNEFNLQKFIISVVIVGVALVIGIYITDSIGDTVKATNTAGTVANETGWLNETGYTLGQASLEDFVAGTLVVLNATDNTTILSGNYTLTSNVLTNATETTWPSVRISYPYTYTASTNASDAADDVVDALATGTSWISILVVVGFAVIILTMLTSGLGTAARREDAVPYY